MRRLLIIFGLIILISCNQNSKTTDTKNSNSTDSVLIPVDNKMTENIDTAEENEEFDEDFGKMRKDYIDNYNQKQKFNDFVIDNSDTFNMSAIYYCSFDSAVNIPKEYVWESDDNFITHNYCLKISITKNGNLILNDTITKNDFFKVLPESLRDYSVLLFPNYRGFDRKSGSFEFGFSLTIPITDVGQGKTLLINKNGQIDIE